MARPIITSANATPTAIPAIWPLLRCAVVVVVVAGLSASVGLGEALLAEDVGGLEAGVEIGFVEFSG